MNEELKELRQDVKQLIKEVAISSELVRQHEARSLELQNRQDLLGERLKPVEDHVKFVSKFLTWAGGIAATALGAFIVQFAVRAIF